MEIVIDDKKYIVEPTNNKVGERCELCAFYAKDMECPHVHGGSNLCRVIKINNEFVVFRKIPTFAGVRVSEDLGFVVVVKYMPVLIKHSRGRDHNWEEFEAPCTYAQFEVKKFTYNEKSLVMELFNGDTEIIPFGLHIQSIKIKKVHLNKESQGN